MCVCVCGLIYDLAMSIFMLVLDLFILSPWLGGDTCGVTFTVGEMEDSWQCSVEVALMIPVYCLCVVKGVCCGGGG